MSIKGQRLDLFGTLATEASGLQKAEQVGPARSELRNGRYTFAGAWRRRPGLSPLVVNPSGSGAISLIPHQGGLIVCRDGSVWSMGSKDLTSTPVQLEGRLTGNTGSVAWSVFDGQPVLARGGAPAVIDGTKVRNLGLQSLSRPSAPGVVVESQGGQVRPGEVEYVASWTTREGETRPSEATAVTVPLAVGSNELGRIITITRPDLPSSETDKDRVRTWRIYRRSSANNDPQLVEELPRDVREYKDNISWENLPKLFHYGLDTSSSKVPASHGIAVSGDHVVVFEGDVLAWSDAGSIDNWTSSSYTSVSPGSGQIRAIKAMDKELFVFCEFAFEVWTNTGGQFTFQRRIVLPRGCVSGASAILAGGTTPLWMGDDHRLYVYTGGKIQDVSGPQSENFMAIERPGELRAIDYRHEGIVALWSPHEESAIIYDYRRNLLSSDSYWDGSKWQHPRVGAYMELRGKRIAAAYADSAEIWTLSEDATDDDGDQIRVVNRLTTGLAESGGRGRANELRLRVQRGRIESPTDVTVRWGVDQGDLYGKCVFTLGEPGDNSPHFTIRGLGVGREMTIEIEHPGSADFLLTSGYLVANDLGERAARISNTYGSLAVD